MRRHQIDQPLEALAFATRIAHGSIIVRSDDDVKIKSTTGGDLRR
jgi:hypothetical protein